MHFAFAKACLGSLYIFAVLGCQHVLLTIYTDKGLKAFLASNTHRKTQAIVEKVLNMEAPKEFKEDGGNKRSLDHPKVLSLGISSHKSWAIETAQWMECPYFSCGGGPWHCMVP